MLRMFELKIKICTLIFIKVISLIFSLFKLRKISIKILIY